MLVHPCHVPCHCKRVVCTWGPNCIATVMRRCVDLTVCQPTRTLVVGVWCLAYLTPTQGLQVPQQGHTSSLWVAL